VATAGATDVDDTRTGVSRLIHAARIGGPVAIGRLFDAAYGYLTFVAARQMARQFTAKFGVSDIVQESAKDAHRGFEGFQGDSSGEFFAWLRSIVHNNLHDQMRKHSRAVNCEVPMGTADGFNAPDDVAEKLVRDDLTAVVNAGIARLPEHYATVLRLRYWERLPYAEIGARMGRTEEAVRKLWVRSLDRLREELPGSVAGDR
jgi:RNA polymerase sigma-70 factor, ECF subfamily